MITFSGIYLIANSRNGKVYVGSACDLQQRERQHRRNLVKGTHPNIKLQNAWKKYGAEAFVFSVVELVDAREDLIRREQFWLDALCSVKNGYNIAPNAGSQLGFKHTPETLEKMRVASSGRKATPESRAKTSAALKGVPKSEEAKRNMAAARADGLPEEVKAKISTANKGRIRSPEVRARMSARMKCQPMREATREALRKANTGRKMSEESRAKISAAHTGMRHSPETRAKISAVQKGIPKKNAQRKRRRHNKFEKGK